ncbi:MAG: cysteine peptidase family C39 domain-containing protein [Leptospiraceae bacterium]
MTVEFPPMDELLRLQIQQQPDDYSCGPTCLQAVYRYFGLEKDLQELISEVAYLREGGTLAVQLGCHALRSGFSATIYTYNLQVFDPTWFGLDSDEFRLKLQAQTEAKENAKLEFATQAYLEFLDGGGRLFLEDLSPSLIRGFLKKKIPILTGLSSTYLYRSPREYGDAEDYDYDDVRGVPSGHFVVLCGYNKEDRKVLVADPYKPSPLSPGHLYPVNMDRLINSILLGILTYDANLLILEKKGARK